MTKKEQKYIKSLKDENDGLRSLLIRFMDSVGKLTNIDDVVNMSLIPIMTEETKRFKAEFKAEAYKECIEKVKEKSKKTEVVASGALITTSYAISAKNLNNLLNELVGGSDGDH